MSTQRIASYGGRSAPPWSDLPDDLLGTVRSRLFSLRDLVRFAAVCKPWRAAVSRQPARAVAPLLLLSSSDDDISHLCGPDYSCVIRAPSKAANMRPVGSQDGGWIALLDTDRHTLAIMNLFSGDEVMLSPEQSNIAPICSSIMRFVPFKVIFSGDPSSSNGCILAAIIEGCLRITLCKVGCHDSRWTTCGDEEFIDIAFCNGELCGLTSPSRDGFLIIKFDIGMERDSMLVLTNINRLAIRRPPSYDDTHHAYISYIFELHGKLSLAVRTRWLPNLDPFLKVFKLVDVDAEEAYKHKCAEVTSLGDYALFVGPTRCKTVHVAESDEQLGLERNRVYYARYIFSSINILPNDALYAVTYDGCDEIKMYCKKDPSFGDGLERTGYYVRGWNYAMWVHPPDL